MIIEEINISDKNNVKAAILKKMLECLDLPEYCHIEDTGKPEYVVFIEKKHFGKEALATLFFGIDDTINIKIDNNEDVEFLRPYLKKSELKFRLTVGDSLY